MKILKTSIASLVLGCAVIFAVFLYGPANFWRAWRAEKFQYKWSPSERMDWEGELTRWKSVVYLFRVHHNGYLGDFLDNLGIINADQL